MDELSFIATTPVNPASGFSSTLHSLNSYSSVTLSPITSSAGAVQLDYPLEDEQCDWLMNQLDNGSEIEVLTFVDGIEKPGLKFFIETYDTDVIAEQGQIQFTGRFLGLRLEEAIVHWNPQSVMHPASVTGRARDTRVDFQGNPSIVGENDVIGSWLFRSENSFSIRPSSVKIDGGHLPKAGELFWEFTLSNSSTVSGEWNIGVVNAVTKEAGPRIDLPLNVIGLVMRLPVAAMADGNRWTLQYRGQPVLFGTNVEFPFIDRAAPDQSYALYEGGLRWFNERTETNVTPYSLMKVLIDEAHSRGAILDVKLDPAMATSGRDGQTSNGTPWNVRWGNDTSGTTNDSAYFLAPGMTLAKVLENLVKGKFCEWDLTDDGTLKMFNYNAMGVDRTASQDYATRNTFRAARDLTEVTKKLDITETATDVFATAALSDEYTMLQRRYDADARTKKGRVVEKYIGELDASDYGPLAKQLSDRYGTYLNAKYELTIGVNFNDPTALQPLTDFNVGDIFYVDTGRGLERRRIVQWTVTVGQGSGISGSVTLGEDFKPYVLQVLEDLQTVTPSKVVTTARDAVITGRSWFFGTGMIGGQYAPAWKLTERTTNGSPSFEWKFVTVDVPGPGWTIETANGKQHIVELRPGNDGAGKAWEYVLPFEEIPTSDAEAKFIVKKNGVIVGTYDPTRDGFAPDYMKSVDPVGTTVHTIPLLRGFVRTASVDSSDGGGSGGSGNSGGMLYETASLFFAAGGGRQYIDLMSWSNGFAEMVDPRTCQIISVSISTVNQVTPANTAFVYPLIHNVSEESDGKSYDPNVVTRDSCKTLYPIELIAIPCFANDVNTEVTRGNYRWPATSKGEGGGTGNFDLQKSSRYMYASLLRVELDGNWPAANVLIRYRTSGQKDIPVILY